MKVDTKRVHFVLSIISILTTITINGFCTAITLICFSASQVSLKYFVNSSAFTLHKNVSRFFGVLNDSSKAKYIPNLNVNI